MNEWKEKEKGGLSVAFHLWFSFLPCVSFAFRMLMHFIGWCAWCKRHRRVVRDFPFSIPFYCPSPLFQMYIYIQACILAIYPFSSSMIMWLAAAAAADHHHHLLLPPVGYGISVPGKDSCPHHSHLDTQEYVVHKEIVAYLQRLVDREMRWVHVMILGLLVCPCLEGYFL